MTTIRMRTAAAALAVAAVGGTIMTVTAAAAPVSAGTTISFTETNISDRTFNLGSGHGFAVGYVELVANKRDMDTALALYNKMTPLLWWVGGPRYVSGTKACFEMMGMPMGPPRAPRLPLPEAQRPALREVLREMGVLAKEKARVRA